MLFPPVYSFFLVGSFQFSSRRTLSSTHFAYCLPCYPRLSIFNWVSNLIDLILYVFCLFLRYTLVNSFCAFLCFRALILVGFLRLQLEAVFMSARFFLTANVSHGTLDLALFLVGMHSTAALSGHWRNSHIRHSECVFLISPVVHGLFS